MFDQFSLLHFAAGVVAYFWGVEFWLFLALHILFEWAENTATGMQFIRALPLWPGGKTVADAAVNRIGDVISGQLGWAAAFLLDREGEKRKWYASPRAKRAPRR